MFFNILFFCLFIISSAFFSASETAIFSLGNLKLRRIIGNFPQAKALKNLIKRPTHLLSAIVFGNLLVNIGLTSLSTAIFVEYFGEKGLILAIFISGTLILFLGEIFPKTFAIYTAERLSLLFPPILSIFTKVFSPLINAIERIVISISSLVIRGRKRSVLSDEEFKAFLLIGKKEGQFSAQEVRMIHHVLEFKDTKASEVLTARIDIKAINSKMSQKEVIDILQKEKHARFPVYQDSLDNVTGIIHAKDIFLNPDEDFHQFLRPPIFIPKTKSIDGILKLLLEQKERIAIVLDEYGGTEGLITTEDIVEEIFGEIYDEFETIQEPLEKIDEQAWRVHGKTPIKTVNLAANLDLPEEEDTIAGFILSQIEKIPHNGENIRFGKINFFIERATTRRIFSVILKVEK
ncbi:MAG: HlyC/CorC family transporter [Candidatus Omnitrophica bacterium]|nr:HlyC/CorC family transporter [Candidatus Omnitrophota bacterium]